MNKITLTPKKAIEIQKNIFHKMPLEKKIKMVYNFFDFAKKVNESNYCCDVNCLEPKDLKDIGRQLKISKKGLLKIKTYKF